MRHPFVSEPNSISSSARFSASIRPLTVKITSPFADLVILSILPRRYFALRDGWVGLLGHGNHNSNRKVINLGALAADKCRNFVDCWNSLQQVQERLFYADG